MRQKIYAICCQLKAASVLAALVMTSGTAMGQSADRIRTTSGSETGEITKMTPVAVTIERGGTATEVPVPEIRSIIYRDEPSQLTQARLNANNGGYEAALNRLDAINLGSITNTYVKQEIEFLRAFCSAKMALVGSQPILEAGKQLNDFATRHSQSYHYLEATELLGDLLATMGNYAAAQKMYERLAQAPWPEYRMRSSVLVGQTLLAQDKFAEALAQFNAVLEMEATDNEGKEQKLAAQLGKAVATAATGNVDAGIQAVEAVIRDADPENAELLAKAYNALGACYQQAGRQKDALYAYLHTDLLYGRVGDAHAEALYHLAPLWETIGQQGEARRARQALETQYPASRWAKQAGE